MQGRHALSFSSLLFFSLIQISCGGGGGNSNIPEAPTPDRISPTIKQITPAPGKSIQANDVITVEFDEEIKQVFTNNVLIRLYDKNGILKSNGVSLASTDFSISNKKTLIINPVNKLIANSKYQIIIKDIKDTSDNIIQSSCKWDFATNTYIGSINNVSVGNCGDRAGAGAGTIDTIAPVIKSITPTGTAVPNTTSIIVKFDEPIDTGTISTSILVSTSVNGTPEQVKTFTYNYNEIDFTVMLIPNVSPALDVNTQYQITIRSGLTGIKDISGNPLETDKIVQFTTLSTNAADTIAPIATLNTPGKTGVALSSDIVVSFNEPMNVNSIKPNIAMSLNAAGSPNILPVLYDYSYDRIQNKAIYTLKANQTLAIQAQYDVTVNTGVKDKNGNNLAAIKVFTFSTILDTTPPDVISLKAIPAEGSLVAPTTQIVIPFNEAMLESTLISNITLSTVDATGQPTTVTTLSDSYNFKYDPATFVVTYSLKMPQTPALLFDTKYRIIVMGGALNGANGAKDIHNNSLTTNFVRNFKTIVLPDTTPPVVKSVKPIEGSSVSENTDIVITFSEPLDQSTLSTNFELYEVVGGIQTLLTFPFAIKINIALDVVTLTPNPKPALLTGKNYRFVIKGDPVGGIGVADSAGNILQTNSITNFSTSTSNQWTWLNGDKNTSTSPVYSGAQLNPGSRKLSASWVGPNGNFWIFGGARSYINYNDFWKYNPQTDQWTEISGRIKTNQPGKFSPVVNTPLTSIYPGARYNATTWTDSNGDFWLFGGGCYERILSDGTTGIGVCNDLWKYSPVTSKWTWVSGENYIDSTGTYPNNLNSPSSTNQPSARGGAVSWIDDSGNLWLFGGIVYRGGIIDFLNDIWKFDPTSSMWSWMGGSQVENKANVYQSTLQAPATVTPSSRFNSVSWKDKQGLLWIFGGEGVYGTGIGTDNITKATNGLNDLWSFDTTTLKWTYRSKVIISFIPVNYGTKLVTAASNYPGAREGASSWLDAQNNLWIYGGRGIGVSISGFLSDLWKFDGTNWTWMHGSNDIGQAPIFPLQGTSTSTSTPGLKSYSTSWIDANGTFWLFGGNNLNNGSVNDLWKYTP